MSSPNHVKARLACEHILVGRQEGDWVEFSSLLRANPRLSWRSLENALQRMEVEGLVRVQMGSIFGGWRRQRVTRFCALTSTEVEA